MRLIIIHRETGRFYCVNARAEGNYEIAFELMGEKVGYTDILDFHADYDSIIVKTLITDIIDWTAIVFALFGISMGILGHGDKTAWVVMFAISSTIALIRSRR